MQDARHLSRLTQNSSFLRYLLEEQSRQHVHGVGNSHRMGAHLFSFPSCRGAWAGASFWFCVVGCRELLRRVASGTSR